MNLTIDNPNYVVLPNDDNHMMPVSSTQIVMPKQFTKPPPHTQNTWYDRNLVDRGGDIIERKCSWKYSQNSNTTGIVCEGQDDNDNWVRGNVFANKFPYKLHHKALVVPETKVILNNKAIVNNDQRVHSMLEENRTMYDYKTYPQQNERDISEREKLYRYPYSIETFSDGLTNGLANGIEIGLFLFALGVIYLIQK